MSTWQPSEQGLSDLLQLLREAVNPTNNSNVQEIPDYNSYLVYILTQMPNEEPYIRSVAGLTLKNNIRSYYPEIPPQIMDHIKECCLQHIGDETIGRAVSLVITAIMARGQVHNWPQGLQVLLEKLDDPSPSVVTQALGTLKRICEDCSHELDSTINGVQPLEFMIPKFLVFFEHPNPHLRLDAINAVQQFITLRSEPLMRRINDFLSGVFNRATDDNVEVRKAVCQALVSILETCPEHILPHMNNLAEYMLFSTQSDDEDLALEACEFWLVFAEQDALRPQLSPYLSKVIPVLLKCMVYSETDPLLISAMDDDAHVADSEQDIKPRFHKAAVVEVERADKNDLDENTKKAGGDYDYEDDEDEDDDDFGLDDDDFYGDWNLRKCSAAALDVMCTAFEGEAINVLMPMLKVELESQDWMHQECGILALGAAAEGGSAHIAPHLPELIPYLFSKLSHNKPLVRSITCWTLGRYAEFIVKASRQSPEARKAFLEPLVQLMLQRILDNNKRVQEAACSSFSLLEEEADKDLVPYLQPILVTLSTAFEKYQHRNLLLLYDTLGTLADVVGEALNTPEYIQLVITPLIAKWQSTPDDDPDIFPLLECLSSVTSALGKAFKPFAEPVYNRCVSLVCKTLEEAHQPGAEEPDKDYMVVALDLLSGIVQALNTDAEPLVANTNPPVVQFLPMCINDDVPEVRQSAYALLGDLAISCFEHIRAVLPNFMPHLIQQIDPSATFVSVCNNATWAAGEITLKLGSEIQPYVEHMLQRLFPLMVTPQLQRTLGENVAITIGRIGLVCPGMVAPHLENFVHPWLEHMSPVRDNEEKASAFSGLCEMIKANPEGAVKAFPHLCVAIADYHLVPPALNESFGNILMGYKNMFGEQQWQQGLASLQPPVRAALQERYHI
ncbi:ARM repeat-containing protein [Hesseltinella vesiculosa]|uniref:ARM repeat-containing protein n=1 Tax=Hesseltinella vesiculosa TaxID=101127 RepID=A0A1X2GB40_9FUNG|nr:ARM repeat-containing protein [Hesseltinella vesiculosa]